jgi:hypothetical protein
MKAKKLYNLSRDIFIGVFTTMLMFSFYSCAIKASFETSSVVPAARGAVKIKKDNNKNYQIKIDIYNLAEANRLQPPKQTYIVWMETNENVTKNIGQINTSTGLLSRKLKASFETVSAIKPTKIYISAEDDANIQNPGAQVVLSTGKF